MGMAASQARYLALVARQSNCEYEGQQINQARLNLSNQSANLFNQMLGLSVPVPPSTQDFTKYQYSFTDGVSNYTIDKWNQLAQPDSEGYNYVVDYHYNANVYTGSQKQMSDPQVQFSVPGAVISPDYSASVRAIQAALKNIEEKTEIYEAAKSDYLTLLANSTRIGTYKDTSTFTKVTNYTGDADSGYTVSYNSPQTETVGDDTFTLYESGGTTYYGLDGKYYTDTTKATEVTDTSILENMKLKADSITFKSYASIEDTDLKSKVADAIEVLKKCDSSIDASQIFYNADDNGNIMLVTQTDIRNLVSKEGTGTATILPTYHVNKDGGDEDSWKSTEQVTSELTKLLSAQTVAKSQLDLAQQAYELLNVPNYVGNNQLTPLSSLTTAQQAEIKQIITDMKAQDVSTNFEKYYNPDTGEYLGGIYQFTQNGITYYTTYDDLANSAINGTGINNIDNQPKLPYYRADYVSTEIKKQEKAILETDSQGRFTSVRFSDDSMKYTLNVETITDDAAYEDAMNKYYYESAKYDKMIQDINAKTSVIQAEDRQLELRLKQLDTERNALTNEIEAVSKVVKDNVEKSFKTFGN